MNTFTVLKTCLPLVAVIFCSLSHAFAQDVAATQAYEPVAKRHAGNKGAFYTGVYPNLFTRQGHSKEQVDLKIATAYAQLFSGDAATEKLYFAAGSNVNGELAYILNPADPDVRSEGMSYGMMIAVQLDHQQEFDALWNWARTYMYEASPASPAFGYYAWSCKPDGTHLSDTPAPDGEEYFAMSLYFAAGRWRSGKGIYDYRARADELLRTMVHKKQTHGPTSFGEKEIGPEFDASSHLAVFLAEPEGSGFTDPSYLLPGLLRALVEVGSC